MAAIRQVLTLSLQEGGSTLKDFVSAEGEQGYFTLNAKVYGKAGKPCLKQTISENHRPE